MHSFFFNKVIIILHLLYIRYYCYTSIQKIIIAIIFIKIIRNRDY